MSLDFSIIDEAVIRGYITIESGKITYLCAKRHTQNFNDSEEKVRAAVYSWLILKRGYPSNRIEINYAVPGRVPSNWADIVLFEDDSRTQPYLLVETKAESATQPEWNQAIEQGFGYANALRTTKYLLVDKNNESLLFDIQNHPQAERIRNRMGTRERLNENYNIASNFRLIAGTATDITPSDPRNIENRVRQAHSTIWAGGKRDPLQAFDEWSKLLFAKIWDERHTPNGRVRRFQVSGNETGVQTATRIRNLFQEARRGDPTIFSDDILDLPDEKIVTVVSIIQDIGFTLCDIDALGAAFEHFFSAIFRGDLGQYFTRRELARFVCGIIEPKDNDIIIDPTVGSGGFLLESLFQVWHYIDNNYVGQRDIERRKIDFALHNLYGIEINSTLGRVCKTNLLIHKDGHTNIETEKTCLDTRFNNVNIRPDGTVFSIVVGNPPFGSTIEEGDRDSLGDNSLNNFDVSRGLRQISSELVIIERGLQFLIPGGRLGMVVPDGALNNSGEISYCPRFRRYLLKNAKINCIVSLPDYAFRKAGAQNKTSLIFLQKYSVREKQLFDESYSTYLESHEIREPTSDDELEAIKYALSRNNYNVFLAEVDEIGYTPSGTISNRNQLYSLNGVNLNKRDNATVIGQYFAYLQNPTTYRHSLNPLCRVVPILDVLNAHPSARLDPKYHLFQFTRIQTPPRNMREYRLGSILVKKEEEIDPNLEPNREFLTLTLSQEGILSQREAGKGRNPPSWHGSYFTDGSRWYKASAGDLIYSQIDLWKGCVAIIPPEYDGAIVTQEFPLYEVNLDILEPGYLPLLLRSDYFQKAIRAITTGHSNRRRTQEMDFEDLKVFLPDVPVQRRIVDIINEKRRELKIADDNLNNMYKIVNKIIIGEEDPSALT